MRGKNWTAAEIEYLEDNWGSVSLPSLAKKLGRMEPQGGTDNLHTPVTL
jgi:hypothetical protein